MNKVVDSLNRTKLLLNNLLVELAGLESMKQLYAKDADFEETWTTCQTPWSVENTMFLDYHT